MFLSSTPQVFVVGGLVLLMLVFGIQANNETLLQLQALVEQEGQLKRVCCVSLRHSLSGAELCVCVYRICCLRVSVQRHEEEFPLVHYSPHIQAAKTLAHVQKRLQVTSSLLDCLLVSG